MNPKKTLVLGASGNPARYSYLAIQRLRAAEHPVVAVGLKPGRVADVDILVSKPLLDDIDTVTLYLNPANQQAYYEYIISLKPRRVIFNPGTENEVLARMLAPKGVTTMEACTLVLLSTGQF